MTHRKRKMISKKGKSNSHILIDFSLCSKDLIGAFDIDSKVKNGRLALIYKNPTAKPQIWFQDYSCQWFFIANTFTDYFRLMIMHLGLPNWHYAFTQVGLDPQTL